MHGNEIQVVNSAKQLWALPLWLMGFQCYSWDYYPMGWRAGRTHIHWACWTWDHQGSRLGKRRSPFLLGCSLLSALPYLWGLCVIPLPMGCNNGSKVSRAPGNSLVLTSITHLLLLIIIYFLELIQENKNHAHLWGVLGCFHICTLCEMSKSGPTNHSPHIVYFCAICVYNKGDWSPASKGESENSQLWK